MNFAAKTMPACWLADTNGKMTAASMPGLKKAMVGSPPVPILGLLRYVSLSLPPSQGDITVPERDIILAGGDMALGLVQHVNMPGWVATATNGQQHGDAAAGHAKLVEYPAGCHIGVDMEGIHDVGQPVLDYLKAWIGEVHAAGYLVVVYWGYAFQVATGAVLALMGPGDVFWTDYGQHTPPAPGFLLHQHSQSMVGGTLVDLDQDTGTDGRGYAFVMMALVQDENEEPADMAITAGHVIPVPSDAMTDETIPPPPSKPTT
jgi:hypothetical protein